MESILTSLKTSFPDVGSFLVWVLGNYFMIVLPMTFFVYVLFGSIRIFVEDFTKRRTIEYLYGSPYITRENLCKQFILSPESADKKIEGIKEQVEKGRYDEFAYIKDDGFVMINYLVLIDYMKYREQLVEKNLCKDVPIFNPKEIAREIEWDEVCLDYVHRSNISKRRNSMRSKGINTQEELIKLIEKHYGFKEELIKNPTQHGLWFVKFEVNGIKYEGSIPFHGALPMINNGGYVTTHYDHETPVEEWYYKEFINGKPIRIIKYIDPGSGDWEDTGIRCESQEEAKTRISNMDNPTEYQYDFVC